MQKQGPSSLDELLNTPNASSAPPSLDDLINSPVPPPGLDDLINGPTSADVSDSEDPPGLDELINGPASDSGSDTPDLDALIGVGGDSDQEQGEVLKLKDQLEEAEEQVALLNEELTEEQEKFEAVRVLFNASIRCK